MNRLTGSSALAVEIQVLRAGAAASAERIKELEARVAELTEEVEDLRATNEALALPERSVLIASFDWSESDEPTAEDAYGWGCQGWGDPR